MIGPANLLNAAGLPFYNRSKLLKFLQLRP
jgi:hypothetical protein